METQYLKLTTTKAIVSLQRSSSTKTGRWTQMGASCDLVPAPPPWPPSPRSLIESSSTRTTWSAPQSCPPPETVSLARWSTRVKAAYYALSFICIVIFSCFAIAALVQRNDQFILGEAVISNIIYVLHHHIYNIT